MPTACMRIDTRDSLGFVVQTRAGRRVSSDVPGLARDYRSGQAMKDVIAGRPGPSSSPVFARTCAGGSPSTWAPGCPASRRPGLISHPIPRAFSSTITTARSVPGSANFCPSRGTCGGAWTCPVSGSPASWSARLPPKPAQPRALAGPRPDRAGQLLRGRDSHCHPPKTAPRVLWSVSPTWPRLRRMATLGPGNHRACTARPVGQGRAWC